MTRYLLVEVVERNISTPELFDTYEAAYDRMCERLASACGDTVEAVQRLRETEDPDDRTGLSEYDAWTEQCGQNFDWRMFVVTSGWLFPEEDSVCK